MRRPNNSGSIIKLSGKRRRPYAVRIFDGIKVNDNGNGTPKYKYLGYFEKQGEALQFLEKYNASPVQLVKPKEEKSKHRFSEIYEMYIDELQLRPKKLSQQSYDSRNAAFKNLKPLHNMIFEAITIDDLESAARQNAHLSASSMSNIMLVLKGMYKTGMRHKYVSEDLSSLMIVDHLDENQRPHTPFTFDEINILWANSSDFYARLFLILIYTGMRVNELLKMKSDHVFLDEQYMVGGLKTQAGKNRQIPIANKIMPFLDTSGEYLIMLDGKQLRYNRARLESTDYLQSLGMDHTFHDTRHTCASLMEKAEVPMIYRKLILGHTTKDITEHYTHINIKDEIAQINRI